jgi:hypothetical protein
MPRRCRAFPTPPRREREREPTKNKDVIKKTKNRGPRPRGGAFFVWFFESKGASTRSFCNSFGQLFGGAFDLPSLLAAR